MGISDDQDSAQFNLPEEIKTATNCFCNYLPIIQIISSKENWELILNLICDFTEIDKMK